MTRCERCHRPLTATRSIARGTGKTCARRIRQEAAVKGFKPETVANALELIEQGAILPVRRSRQIFAAASMSGAVSDRYLCTPKGCNCKGGLYGKICRHRVAAVILAA